MIEKLLSECFLTKSIWAQKGKSLHSIRSFAVRLFQCISLTSQLSQDACLFTGCVARIFGKQLANRSPIVAMWNPRAGATPSCIWWRAFLGILESSQLLTVLLNLPTVDNFHFLLLDSEDKLLRYSCNRSNRPLRSDCGMLWAKLTKLESPPAACHPISPMKSTVAMSPCKECRIPTWPIAVLNYDLPVIMLPPKCRQFRTKACWVPVCFTQQPGCTDVSCKVPRFSPPTSDRPPKGFNASVADSKVYFNVVSTHQNWYEMQLHKIYEWAPAHWSSWSIIVNGSCSLSLSLTHALPWFLTWL